MRNSGQRGEPACGMGTGPAPASLNLGVRGRCARYSLAVPRPAPTRPATAAQPLSELTALLGLPGTEPAAVTGITHDSREAREGDLYVALPGSRVHGSDFAPEAVAAGAVAILTDREGERAARELGVPVLAVADPRAVLGRVAAWVYGDPADALSLIGVTGTSGKTTVTFLLEGGLAAAGHLTGLVGTVQARVVGDAWPSTLTTPEATDLHALFAVMRERGVSAAAVEVSSHALAFGRAAGATYDVAVFTNLSPEHLDFHRDLEDYFAAKATLFTPAYSRCGVVNLDDPWGRRLAEQAPVPVATFSAEGHPGADWRAEHVNRAGGGNRFRVVGPGGAQAEASAALPGAYNVSNALAAVVALVQAGVPLDTAACGVSAVDCVPGRAERVDAGQEFLALVDYAHKPAAVEALLEALRPLAERRLIVVVGCGGNRDRAKRPQVGAAAARLADLAVLTNDNPRAEDPLAILSAVQSGALEVSEEQRAHVVVEPDRAAAIELAVARAAPADVLVVAGKGHEQGQEVRGVTRPFDDRAVLRAALTEAGAPGPRGGPGPVPGGSPAGDVKGAGA